MIKILSLIYQKFKFTINNLRTPKHIDYGLNLGVGTIFHTPRYLEGAKNIYIGDRTKVGIHSWLSAIDKYAGIEYSPKLIIGSDVYIGTFVCITCIDAIEISNGCVLSEFVYVTDHGHGFDPDAGLIMDQPLTSKGGVHIGKNTFVGFRACILSGVTIGEHCIIGANTVVTSSIPAYSMVVGSPGRIIKTYSQESKSWIPNNQ